MSDIIVRESDIQGTGVFAARDFEIGERIYEYKPGRLVKRSDIMSLTEEEREHLDVIDNNTYELMQSPAVYVNHSCDPNMIEKDRVGYALKPIKKGDELTTDYRIRAYDDWQMKCNCGSQNCFKVVVGNFFSLPLDLQKKYLEYAPKFIQDEFKGRNRF